LASFDTALVDFFESVFIFRPEKHNQQMQLTPEEAPSYSLASAQQLNRCWKTPRQMATPHSNELSYCTS